MWVNYFYDNFNISLMVNKGAECFLVYSLFLRILILRIVIAVTNFIFRKHLYNTYILVYIITSYNP